MQPKFYSTNFNLQAAINDCSVNELLDSLYSADLLHLPLKVAKINTSTLKLLLGGDLTTQFGSDMPCKVIISPTEVPKFTKNYVSASYDTGNYWELASTI